MLRKLCSPANRQPRQDLRLLACVMPIDNRPHANFAIAIAIDPERVRRFQTTTVSIAGIITGRSLHICTHFDLAACLGRVATCPYRVCEHRLAHVSCKPHTDWQRIFSFWLFPRPLPCTRHTLLQPARPVCLVGPSGTTLELAANCGAGQWTRLAGLAIEISSSFSKSWQAVVWFVAVSPISAKSICLCATSTAAVAITSGGECEYRRLPACIRCSIIAYADCLIDGSHAICKSRHAQVCEGSFSFRLAYCVFSTKETLHARSSLLANSDSCLNKLRNTTSNPKSLAC